MISAAIKFASATPVESKDSCEMTETCRDPKIQIGWDNAKAFAAAKLTLNVLVPLLRQAKDSRGFIHPNNEYLPEDPYCQANMVIDDLAHSGKDRMNCQIWSSYEALCSKELSESEWDNDIPYPEHKGSPIEFHSVGALGSNETRQIINDKILPDLGLGDFIFRSYPGYEFWNKKKHSPSQRGAHGRLVGPEGEQVPAIRLENEKKIRRYDVSLVRKKQNKHQTTQEISVP